MTAGRIAVLAVLTLFVHAPLAAAERYALVVSGASGSREYATRFHAWRTAFVSVLVDALGYDRSNIVVLAETPSESIGPATVEGVAEAVSTIAAKAGPDDIVLVLLIGHGTVFEGDDARFNLVGPDLTAAQWAEQLAPVRGRLVFVNTAAGSHGFLRALAGKGRIVVSATDGASQRYATVFPDFFVRAFEDGSADLDKNGRVSMWEAFTFASAGVRGWFENQGRLATERALLDDNGDGRGSEAGGEGDDGGLSQLTYLQTERLEQAGDPDTRRLLEQRQAVVDALDRLRVERERMPPAQYDAELERLLLDLARIDRDLRGRP